MSNEGLFVVVVVGVAGQWPASLSDALVRAGWGVCFEPTPAAAAARAGRRDAGIRAVVLDAKLVSLAELGPLRELRAGRPQLRVILVSGGSSSPLVHRALASYASVIIPRAEIERTLPSALGDPREDT